MISFLHIIYIDILTVSHSLNTIVSICFWSVYFYDNDLAENFTITASKEIYTSLFTQVCEHLAPFFFTLLALFAVKEVPPVRRMNRFYLFLIVFYYAMIIMYFRKSYGNYPYNVLNLLNDYLVFLIGLITTLIADLLVKFYYDLLGIIKANIFLYL